MTIIPLLPFTDPITCAAKLISTLSKFRSSRKLPHLPPHLLGLSEALCCCVQSKETNSFRWKQMPSVGFEINILQCGRHYAGLGRGHKSE